MGKTKVFPSAVHRLIFLNIFGLVGSFEFDHGLACRKESNLGINEDIFFTKISEQKGVKNRSIL